MTRVLANTMHEERVDGTGGLKILIRSCHPSRTAVGEGSIAVTFVDRALHG